MHLCRTDEGRLRNADLVDYKLVTAADTPEIRIAWIETPTKNAGPHGAKGSASRRAFPPPARWRTPSPG
jgi:CO/xanthine dehydrogenase Mo-binding subunit